VAITCSARRQRGLGGPPFVREKAGVASGWTSGRPDVCRWQESARSEGAIVNRRHMNEPIASLSRSGHHRCGQHNQRVHVHSGFRRRASDESVSRGTSAADEDIDDDAGQLEGFAGYRSQSLEFLSPEFDADLGTATRELIPWSDTEPFGPALGAVETTPTPLGLPDAMRTPPSPPPSPTFNMDTAQARLHEFATTLGLAGLSGALSTRTFPTARRSLIDDVLSWNLTKLQPPTTVADALARVSEVFAFARRSDGPVFEASEKDACPLSQRVMQACTRRNLPRWTASCV